MKIATIVAASLLGLMFIASSAVVLLNVAPSMDFPEGSPPAHFMAAMGPTGYMTFVKILELAGGVLLIIPKTRNFGLLVLGPIIINILAYHVFVARAGVFDPMIIGICALAAFLLWAERKAFAGLLR